ncbi:hypothetical protein MRX96_027078 [Rhipicephalus microplus]
MTRPDITHKGSERSANFPWPRWTVPSGSISPDGGRQALRRRRVQLAHALFPPVAPQRPRRGSTSVGPTPLPRSLRLDGLLFARGPCRRQVFVAGGATQAGSGCSYRQSQLVSGATCIQKLNHAAVV